MSEETIAKNLSIKQWAEDDRPREKLLLKGRTSLSDAELIAILIATGTREESAVDLSKKILSLTGNNLNELGKLSVKDLQKVKGIGEAKSISIVAALELGRRRKEEEVKEKPQIKSSKDSYKFFKPILADLPYEEFWIMLLNRANRLITHKRISGGGVSGTIVDVKIVFKYAIENLASSIVLCHNHPSGSLYPSESDIRLTKQIRESGKVLDISILDHIIVGERDYYSFVDNRLF